MNRYAIIVAGGKGLRMGHDIPKQFLELKNKPILMHTIEAFAKADSSITIIVALPKDSLEYWKNLCKKHDFTIKHKLVEGGETRFDSVKNALSEILENGVVAIHDGVRPLICSALINTLFKEAEISGNAIPCCNVVESLRFVSENSNIAVNRSEYKSIQTPQVFKAEIIKKAYNQAKNNLYTDDASVIEELGYSINLVEGEDTNIKITSQKDLLIANIFIDFKK